MNEFPESIKFVESPDGHHAWKRLNDEGGVEYISPLFLSRELAEADARANINGTHAVEAPESVDEAPVQPEAVEPAPEAEVPADEPAPEAPAEVLAE